MESNRYDEYQSPLTERYVTREMNEIFSPNRKFRTWRRLWIALAEAEREVGLPISQEQIDEMKWFQDEINYEEAERKEREIRHDVMAHIYAFGLQCPQAKRIIHLGATSAYVVDNTDLIVMREALIILRAKLVNIIDALGSFASVYKALPTLSFTHFQPAQLTTVGKRATLWIQDLVLDLEELEYRLDHLKFLGVKGTTGTQESFMKLLGGDEEKIRKLEELVAEKMEFGGVFPVSGQTYPRKVDSQILSLLSGIAQSAHKFSEDLRLLQHLKEIEEPFEEEQVGSSAMAYKRNPMRSERMAGLARHLICNSLNPAFTSATQWFERTLDDSANKRLSIPEAFMVADGLLNIYLNVAQGLVVYPRMIRRHIDQELPFMATEEILMEAVKAGGDRQLLHEQIRRHSMEAGRVVKEEGGENDLLRRVMEDPAFAQIKGRIPEILDPIKFVGRAPQQVQEFLAYVIEPIRSRYQPLLGLSAELNV